MKKKHSRRSEGGYVLVTVSVSLFMFLSLFALVADLGHIFVTKAELQNTTDAAVMAAVVELPNGNDASRTKALDFGQSHWVAGSSIAIEDGDVVFGGFDFLNFQFQPGVEPTRGVQVTARRVDGSPSGALPLFFAALFGKETSNVQARALAVLDPHVVGVKGKNRLIPYSSIDFEVDTNDDGAFDIGTVLNIHPRNDAPGNFGFLDLDGGSNDVPELRDYIENGYDRDFTIPAGGSHPVYGSTGIDGNSVLPSFKEIIGEVVFMPVHDRVDYEGANAVFNVVGVLAVRVESVKLTGAPEGRHIRAEIVYFASSVLVTDPNAPVNNSLAKPRLIA